MSWIGIHCFASCSMLHATYVSHFITCAVNVIHFWVLTFHRVRTYTFAIYAQTFYIITNRGEAFLARRREDLFLVCVCVYETFQSVHQIICELFSYWISPPSQLLPRLSFWAYLHAPDLSNLPANLSSHLSIKPCCWQINISNYILMASCFLGLMMYAICLPTQWRV